MDITKRDAKAALGFTKDSELARFFDIGRAAVGFWEEDKAIPDARQWELRARRPDLFGKPERAAA